MKRDRQTKIFNPKSTKKRRQYLRNNMTEAEIKLWSALKSRQLDEKKFRRQHGIGKYVVDFYCPELSLVVEVDGESHYFKSGLKHDIKRSEFFNNLDIKVIRFTNPEVLHNLNGVLVVLEKEIKKLSNQTVNKS